MSHDRHDGGGDEPIGWAMDFGLTDDQTAIVEGVGKAIESFDDAYWLERDRDGEFPHAFYDAIAAGGWLGIAMPETYGGAGLGVTEAALTMGTIAASGGAMAAASSVHMNIFGPRAIVAHASEEQKRRWLPPLIEGRYKMCFAVTEPNAGLDTARIAPRRDDAPTAGLSLFFTDLDRATARVREIEKMGRKAVDSNEIWFDGMRVPEADRIGEEGKGFRYILESLNPERILVAAEAVGIGRDALRRAARYAGERVVFGRPIGANQGIQHPLAASWSALEAAHLATMKAAWLYDRGEACGVDANAAKYLAVEAGFEACKQAVASHGGMGYAREFHVERLMREIVMLQLAPVSQHLALNYIAERALGLPKSY